MSKKMVQAAQRYCFLGAVLCVAGGAVLLPPRSVAADGVNFEGTWKITAPQAAFKAEGGAIPFTAQGRKVYGQNKRYQAKLDFDKYDYATSNCASPGVPRLMLTPDRFRIWQRPGVVTFLFEWNRLFRQIDMGGLLPRPKIGGPGGPGDEALIGRAIPTAKGHWEGDTLVANTWGFDDSTLIDNLLPHGEGLKLTERLRLTDADTLEDRITIEDAEYFMRPWQTLVTYKRQPTEPFPENVCLEGLFAKRAQSK